MELLAPAGSMESLKAAVFAGADAVYVGGKKFNARSGANNFSIEELKEATKFAHDYGVKVYLTINILNHESELKEVGYYLCDVANCGIDAFIIQDLGVVELAKQVTPHIELHASTQMAIHSSEGLAYLQKRGIKRVVLSREVSLNSIKEMSKCYKNIGLEVFAHGALCYAYSGQCLMSSMIGGRSGNRGSCAGPCRLPYSLLENGKAIETPGKYLMSPKDLCLVADLNKLKEAGASSIKIEGRLKRPEYVYTVVSEYRKAIDQGPKYRYTKETDYRLKQAFNRGFTKGLIFGHKGNKLMNISRPDNRGINVAVVKDCYKGKIKIKTLTSLQKGDVLSWHNGERSRTFKLPKDYDIGAFIVVKSEDNVKINTEVSRVVSSEQIRKSANAMRRPLSKYNLDFHVTVMEGKPLILKARDEHGNEATYRSINPLEKAMKRAAEKDYILNQLSKLGGTKYMLNKCEVKIVGNPLVRASELNNARREVLRLIENKESSKTKLTDTNQCRHSVMEHLLANSNQKNNIQIPKLAISVSTASELKAALKSDVDIIYYGSQRYEPLEYDVIKELSAKQKDRLVLRLPRISLNSDKTDLDKLINDYLNMGINKILVDNIGELMLCNSLENVEIISGCGIPVFNSKSVEQLKKEKVKRVTLSPELNYQQISQISENSILDLELIIHGEILLMVHESAITEDLVLDSNLVDNQYSLKDRKNYIFPIRHDSKRRSYLYNSQDLALYNKIEDIIKANISVLRIEANNRGENYVSDIVSVYRYLIKNYDNKELIDYENIFQTLKKHSPNGLTKGHYGRGV